MGAGFLTVAPPNRTPTLCYRPKSRNAPAAEAVGKHSMPYYIVNSNRQSNGDYEVHLTPRWSCSSPRYPNSENQVSLEFHTTCHGAVREAKRLGYGSANGCFYCAHACHTG